MTVALLMFVKTISVARHATHVNMVKAQWISMNRELGLGVFCDTLQCRMRLRSRSLRAAGLLRAAAAPPRWRLRSQIVSRTRTSDIV